MMSKKQKQQSYSLVVGLVLVSILVLGALYYISKTGGNIPEFPEVPSNGETNGNSIYTLSFDTYHTGDPGECIVEVNGVEVWRNKVDPTTVWISRSFDITGVVVEGANSLLFKNPTGHYNKIRNLEITEDGIAIFGHQEEFENLGYTSTSFTFNVEG